MAKNRAAITAENDTTLSLRPPLWQRTWAHLLLLLAVSLAAYANTFSVPFVFDDYTSIAQNPVVKSLERFVAGAGYDYNPRRFVGYLTLALNYHFGGLEMAGYHAVNLAVHVGTSALVYSFAALLLRTPLVREEGGDASARAVFIPLCAALVFALHPLQTQAVTYIVQRLASLAAFWYLAAMVLYLKGRLMQEAGRERSRFLPLMAAAALVAIMAMRTKEIAYTLPAAVLLLEFSCFRMPARKRLVFVVPLLCVLLALAVAFLQVDRPLGELLSDVNEMTRETRDIPRSAYLFTQFSVIMTYLRLLVLPVAQNLDYDYPLHGSLLSPQVLSSLLGIVLLLAGAIWLYRASRRQGLRVLRLAGFGVLWFFLTLSVESSVIPIRDVIFEHRLYLPTAGLFIALSSSLWFIGGRRPSLLSGAVAVVCLALGAATFNRNAVWHDNITLWSDVVAKSPQKSRPHFNLGKSYADAGRLPEAISSFQRALALFPNDPETLYNMGVVTAKGGDEAGAEALYRQALVLDPRHANAIHNLAQMEAVRGNYAEAERLFLQVRELDSQSAVVRSNLGLLYRITNRHAQAESEYRAALELDPRDADVWNRLGVLYVSQGRIPAAVEQFRRAVMMAPDRPEFAENLRKSLAMQQ